MKKTLIFSLVLLFCFCASAENVQRMKNVDMEGSLSDMTVHVGFETADVTDTSLYASIYDVVTYDIADIAQLKAGDTIETSLGDITVETIENADGMVIINGGDDEDGVILMSIEDTNGYFETDYELPALIMVGQAQLSYADTVTINVYKMGEDLGITGEGYDTITVAGNEVSAVLTTISELFYGSMSPYSVTVTFGSEDAVITEVTVDYMP